MSRMGASVSCASLLAVPCRDTPTDPHCDDEYSVTIYDDQGGVGNQTIAPGAVTIRVVHGEEFDERFKTVESAGPKVP